MYLSPATVEEACEALAGAPAAILSGGTDFYPSLGERPPPARVIDISRTVGLAGVARSAEGWRIGAGTTWTALARADLPPAFDALKEAAREVGSVQVQNVASIGGNICNASPAADGVPPLLALDAEVELRSREGSRSLALAEFLVGNRRTRRRADEILTAILVPGSPAGSRSSFRKLGSRRYLVISVASVAAVLAPSPAGSPPRESRSAPARPCPAGSPGSRRT